MAHWGSRITYRPANFDTPEVAHRAECDAERAAGERATAAVQELFNEAERIDVRATGRLDRYGRTVAFISIDGRDLGAILIKRGIARPWRGLSRAMVWPEWRVASLIPSEAEHALRGDDQGGNHESTAQRFKRDAERRLLATRAAPLRAPAVIRVVVLAHGLGL